MPLIRDSKGQYRRDTTSPAQPCGARNCLGIAEVKGICRKHYKRLRRHGELEPIVSPLPITVDDAFGHWLAGFIDGEGCFTIRPTHAGGGMACVLTISLRDDDRPILEEIQLRTGFGHIATDSRQHPASVRYNSKPQAKWVVTDKAGALTLVVLLDKYPLRGKKRRDYAIWREAVLRWRYVRRGNGIAKIAAALKLQIEAVRKYPDSGAA